MIPPSLPTTLCCLALLTGQAFAAKIVPDHAIANLVLGQPDFTTRTAVAPITSFKLGIPSAAVIDPVTRKVFVADTGFSRVLRYPNVASLDNGAPAEAVFGHDSFSDSSGSGGATALDSPRGLFLDRYGRLWVADTGNHRVLVYEAAAFRANGPTADLFFGQPNLATITPGTTASKMTTPVGVWVDTDDTLWVAEFGNNRVIGFGGISTKTSGSAANVVLGQSNFTTSTAGSGTTGLQGPVSVTASATGSLFVACLGGNRVLRFDNTASLSNNDPASAVFGQPNFFTVTAGLSARKFNFSQGVFITPDDTLWVSDSGNHRLLRFENASTRSSGSAANGVVGQPDFTTATSGTTAQALVVPQFPSFVDSTGSLWVPDAGNNRVLRFPPDLTKPALDITSNVPKNTTRKKLTIRGTASDKFGISEVLFRKGNGPLKTATGTTDWQFTVNLARGRNKITIIAEDSVGNRRSRVFNIRRNAP